jgi:predicted Zn-dependent protease
LKEPIMRRNTTTPIVYALALLPLLSLSTGCSVLQPKDPSVIAQANQVHSQLAPAVIHDRDVESYMDAIGRRIVKGAQEYDRDPDKVSDEHKKQDNAWLYNGDIQFHLVNSKTLNAFTTGGQHVYIYNQLFQDAQSEDELAAVMAHEFAHIYARHVAKGTGRQYIALGAAGAGALAGYAVGGQNKQTSAGLGAGAAGAVAQFFNMGFTRDDENEADKLGFSFYIRAGWDPDHFADFFKQMIAQGYDKTPEMASDHPKLSNRVAATEERVARIDPQLTRQRLRDPIADRREFQQIQQRAIAAARNTPDDQSLAKAQLMLQAFPSCVTPTDQPDQPAAQQELLHAAEEAEAAPAGRSSGRQAPQPRRAAGSQR